MSEAGTPQKRWRISTIICLFLAAYFAGTALFALIHANQFASARPQLLRYVIAPGTIAILLALCAWKMRPDARAITASCGLAIFVGMFAFEFFMTARTYSATMGLVALPEKSWLRAQRVDDTLPPSRTVKALNTAIGVTALSDAVLGNIPGKRVYLCSSGAKPIFYQADQMGFNNPPAAYARAPDIMVVGDSFVEGICLEPAQTLVGQLRRTTTATLGIGNRGAGPLYGLAATGRYGGKFHPRTVVMAFFEGNDWENLEAELRTPYLRQALSPNADFGGVTPAPATLERAHSVIDDWQNMRMPGAVEMLSRTHSLRNLAALQKTSLSLGIAYPKAPPAIPEYSRILARTKQIVEGWGGHLIILYIPLQDRFLGLINRDFVYDQVRSKVLASAAKNGIPVVDLAPIFRSHPQPETLYAADAHFSAQGAHIAAGAVTDFLKRRDLRLADHGPDRDNGPAL
ncbi:alginate O-acetyltransferase AlgX-related protein [Sphingomonas sp. C3-2]|uniref:alginate O-acetyltransferase AlgX-related protein n=1 Tax=Sphingomonas sp. C3-2 TaxID=3062169 RepID=UPI00294B2F37|nr:hypothetical protein [Sphingomonas sp. C3-2]WOK36531.1 hypothetical protein QYC26_16255 [Sphingomonas sp. C3-2]